MNKKHCSKPEHLELSQVDVKSLCSSWNLFVRYLCFHKISLCSILLLGVLTHSANAEFTNVINIPGASGSFHSIGRGTQLNLYEGGSLMNGLSAHSGSELNVFGGSIGTLIGGQLNAFDGSLVNIAGGNLRHLTAYEGSEVNISGGNFDNGVRAYIGSTVNISGGNIEKSLVASRDSILNITGGIIDTRLYGQGGVINISGGIITDRFNAAGGSILNVSGGRFEVGTLHRDTILNIKGSDFKLDGLSVEGIIDGEAIKIPDGDSQLTGILADGSPFEFRLNAVMDGVGFVANSETVTLALVVPEPATFLPLLLSVALFFKRQ